MTSMFCHGCSGWTKEGDNFCTHCGSRFTERRGLVSLCLDHRPAQAPSVISKQTEEACREYERRTSLLSQMLIKDRLDSEESYKQSVVDARTLTQALSASEEANVALHKKYEQAKQDNLALREKHQRALGDSEKDYKYKHSVMAIEKLKRDLDASEQANVALKKGLKQKYHQALKASKEQHEQALLARQNDHDNKQALMLEEHRQAILALEDRHRLAMQAVEDRHRQDLSSTKDRCRQDLLATEDRCRKDLLATEERCRQDIMATKDRYEKDIQRYKQALLASEDRLEQANLAWEKRLEQAILNMEEKHIHDLLAMEKKYRQSQQARGDRQNVSAEEPTGADQRQSGPPSPHPEPTPDAGRFYAEPREARPPSPWKEEVSCASYISHTDIAGFLREHRERLTDTDRKLLQHAITHVTSEAQWVREHAQITVYGELMTAVFYSGNKTNKYVVQLDSGGSPSLVVEEREWKVRARDTVQSGWDWCKDSVRGAISSGAGSVVGQLGSGLAGGFLKAIGYGGKKKENEDDG
ncbi:uncharacterized protein LOC144872169 [Branchiostoma floridae x Branchiostoma japonicum]